LSFRDSDGVQVEPDFWEFTQTYYESGKIKQETGKHVFQLSEDERKKYEKKRVTKLHRSEVVFDSVLLLKVKDLFGVDLDAKFLDGSFVDLGKEISSK